MTFRVEKLQHFVGGQVVEYLVDEGGEPTGEEYLRVITAISDAPNIDGVREGFLRIDFDPGWIAQYDSDLRLWQFCPPEDYEGNDPWYVAEEMPVAARFVYAVDLDIFAGEWILRDASEDSVLVLTPPDHSTIVNPDEILGVPAAERG